MTPRVARGILFIERNLFIRPWRVVSFLLFGNDWDSESWLDSGGYRHYSGAAHKWLAVYCIFLCIATVVSGVALLVHFFPDTKSEYPNGPSLSTVLHLFLGITGIPVGIRLKWIVARTIYDLLRWGKNSIVDHHRELTRIAAIPDDRLKAEAGSLSHPEGRQWEGALSINQGKT